MDIDLLVPYRKPLVPKLSGSRVANGTIFMGPFGSSFADTLPNGALADLNGSIFGYGLKGAQVDHRGGSTDQVIFTYGSGNKFNALTEITIHCLVNFAALTTGSDENKLVINTNTVGSATSSGILLDVKDGLAYFKIEEHSQADARGAQGGVVVVDEWFLITGTWKTGFPCKVYVNGVLGDTAASNSTTMPDYDNLWIGGRETGVSDATDGIIAFTHILNYRMDDAEVFRYALDPYPQFLEPATSFPLSSSPASDVNITATQTEASETNSVSVQNLINLTVAQTESSETNAVLLSNFINLVAAQTEASEVNNVTLLVGVRNITLAQTELSEVSALRILQADYSEAFFTVNFAGLNVDSHLAGDPIYTNLAIGDSFVGETETPEDAFTWSMSGDGVITLAPPGLLPQDQTIDFYIHDVSDGTNGTPATLTIDAGMLIQPVQTEASEVNVVSIQAVAGPAANLTAAQTEVSEINSVFVNAIIDAKTLTAAQTEASEINSVSLELLVNLTATQTELAETQDILILAKGITLTIAQTESSETNELSLEGFIITSWIPETSITAVWTGETPQQVSP